jgi:hypothetical protein
VIVYDSGNDSEVATTQTDASGLFEIEIESGPNYQIRFVSDSYMDVTYFNVTIEPGVTVFLETVLQIESVYSGNGTVGGTIRDAFSGELMADVSLQLREGINVHSGDVVFEASTDNNGYYQIAEVPAGYYTAQLSGNGYNNSYFSILSIGSQERLSQNAAISPVISEGETRIVLSWGSTPRDLDSHLYGPGALPEQRFHIYYANRGASASEPFANLDTDDTSSFGPETITIYQQREGTYSYYVHNFSSFATPASRGLSASQAKVEIYQHNGSSTTFNVPAGKTGIWWHVFDLQGERIIPVNRITESNPENSTLGALALPQKPIDNNAAFQ